MAASCPEQITAIFFFVFFSRMIPRPPTLAAASTHGLGDSDGSKNLDSHSHVSASQRREAISPPPVSATVKRCYRLRSQKKKRSGGERREEEKKREKGERAIPSVPSLLFDRKWNNWNPLRLITPVARQQEDVPTAPPPLLHSCYHAL